MNYGLSYKEILFSGEKDFRGSAVTYKILLENSTDEQEGEKKGRWNHSGCLRYITYITKFNFSAL